MSRDGMVEGPALGVSEGVVCRWHEWVVGSGLEDGAAVAGSLVGRRVGVVRLGDGWGST